MNKGIIEYKGTFLGEECTSDRVEGTFLGEECTSGGVEGAFLGKECTSDRVEGTSHGVDGTAKLENTIILHLKQQYERASNYIQKNQRRFRQRANNPDGGLLGGAFGGDTLLCF